VVPAEFHYITDPACEKSWAVEPILRRLEWEFDGELRVKRTMAGMARSFSGAESDRLGSWIDAAASSGMPFDPRIWRENPPQGTYPACLAVKAAAEQGADQEGRFLRRLREAIMCERHSPGSVGGFEALAAEAGLDVRRFGIDLESTATLEAFGSDLETAERAGARDGDLPVALFLPLASIAGKAVPGVAADVHRAGAGEDYGAWRATALAAGARTVNPDRPALDQAFDRFGRLAGPELSALTGLPEPVLEAELWAGAREWRYRPRRILTGTLWEPA